MGKRKYLFKKMKKGECRVIRIDSEAILEFVQGEIRWNTEAYFNIPLLKYPKGMFHWCMDEETGDIIICYSNDVNCAFDKVLDKVLEKVDSPTTESMYQAPRYISLFFNTEDGSLSQNDTGTVPSDKN